MRRWLPFGLVVAFVAAALAVAVPATAAAPATPTVTITADPPGPSTYGEDVTFTVKVTGTSGTPTGEVDINNVPVGDCEALELDSSGSTNCESSDLPVGVDTITAQYYGDDRYANARGSLTYTVAKAPTTTTLEADPPHRADQGKDLTFTATIEIADGNPPNNGRVEFSSDGLPLSGCAKRRVNEGTATCPTPYVAAGQQTIRARYLGSADYLPSQGELPYYVRTHSTASLTASPRTHAAAGQLVTLHLGVTASPFVAAAATAERDAPVPSGTVTVTSNGNPITGCAGLALHAGHARCRTNSLAVGKDNLRVTYSGDATYARATARLPYRIDGLTATSPTLANTGSDTGLLVRLAIVLLALGCALVLLARVSRPNPARTPSG